MAGKQTGPAQRVKRTDRVWAGIGLTAVALMLAGCAGTAWTQAGKTDAQKRTDLAMCERQAESDTLGNMNRGDYPLPTSSTGTMPGSRTSNPLELNDRSEVTSRYDRILASCMRGKGYMQGHAADQRPTG